MDPSDNDVEAVDEALMAQMGFSSFGAASPPSKRRRYNPNADALPPSKSSATGANSTALGTGSNTNEIVLDDDDDDNQNEDKSGRQVPAQERPASLPQRPAPASAPRQGQHSVPHERKETWYIGYYDHLSNGNPWEKIEKARGLTSRGTWLSRENGNAAATADAPA